MRLRILRSRIMIGGWKYVQRIQWRIRKYVRIYKTKQTDVIRQRIVYLRREYRDAKRIWGQIRSSRRRSTVRRTTKVQMGRRMYRRVVIIRRRIQRTRRVFKRVKNPSKAVLRVYRKKIQGLTRVYNRLIKIGRVSKTRCQQHRDVKYAVGNISGQLQKVLHLAKRASTEPAAQAKKTQKRIVDLLKENIKNTQGVSEKLKNLDDKNCDKKGLVQVTQTPAANATANA